VWSKLLDTSGTPNEQARRMLFLLFPTDVAESFYRQFGDIVAAARARLSVELLNRQAAAMDVWHRNGLTSQLRHLRLSVLIATGTEDIVIPASKCPETRKHYSWRLACSVPSRRPWFYGAVSTSDCQSNQLLSRDSGQVLNGRPI
jgi:hypothetical protein